MPINVDPISTESGNHYGSEAGMRKLIALNLDIFGDLDNDGTIDAGVIEDVLTRSDVYLRRNLIAGPLGVTPPRPEDLGAANEDVAASLRDLGDHMGVWYIAHDRGLLETSANQRSSANSIAGGVGGYKTYVDEELAKLAGLIESVDEDDTTASAGTFVSVPIDYGNNPVTDEFSR